MNHITICAEIGQNHGGSLKQAMDLIRLAKFCGCNAVKFQAYKTDELFSNYPGIAKMKAEMKKREIPDKWWPSLIRSAKNNGLMFGVSIFDDKSLENFKGKKLDFVKVASGEIDNFPLIQKQIDLSDVFVISTGAATLDEIYRIYSKISKTPGKKVILLECTSQYPAEPAAVNLKNIDFLHSAFDCQVGYSDHSKGIHYPIAAAARGATWIEKHFCIKRLNSGDYSLSAEPDEMKTMIKAIREIEQSLKTNRKEFIQHQEIQFTVYGRKSLYAHTDLEKERHINSTNTTMKRPAAGVKFDKWGMVLEKDIQEGAPVTASDLMYEFYKEKK